EHWKTLREVFASYAYAGETLALLQRHYREGRTLREAFAGLLAEVFAEEGLILFNPREMSVMEQARPLFLRCLEDASEIQALCTQRAQELQASGYAVQIPQRAHSTLCFFHPEGAAGPRYRLLHQEGTFSLSGGKGDWSLAALTQAVHEDPCVMSTSALLRPLLQDSLFPTLAYVGGPSEASYFAQLAPLYKHFEMTMPMFFPRGRFTMLCAQEHQTLQQLELSWEDLQRPEPELLRLLCAREPMQPLSLEQLEQQLLHPYRTQIEALQTQVEQLDPNLGKSLERVQNQIEQNLSKFFLKVQKSRFSQAPHQTWPTLKAIQQALFPQSVPQERLLNFATFVARLGLSKFKQYWNEAYRPFQVAPHTLVFPEGA
ncbi:MAG: bacillithiol biosynthesis BshC, partial [Myxococcota bacterium]